VQYELKPILILSYFFPPCNLTAAQRIKGWANYLHKSGYYPTIITRNWDAVVSSPEDVLQSTGTEIVHHKFDTYEVYYVPYKASLRDRLYKRLQQRPVLRKATKMLTFFALITENFSSRMIAHRNLYTFARHHLRTHPEYKQLIVSGNPFDLFRFGYLLHKKTGIQWFADYRDDWNTSSLVKNQSWLERFLHFWSSRSEKKWVGTTRAIFSVSEVYASKISEFVGIEGFTILNGFELDEKRTSGSSSHKSTERATESETETERERETEGQKLDHKARRNEFVITYNGSLYPSQPIEPFLKVIQRLEQDPSVGVPIRLQFPGLGFDPDQVKRVKEYTKGFSTHVNITSRIPREEVIEMQQHADVLLMIAHEGIKGIPSSKLYEYIGLEKPVVLFPNDGDIIARTLTETGLGHICDTEVVLETTLRKLIRKKQLGEPLATANRIAIQTFSRETQTAQLATLLHAFQRAL